MRRFLELAFGTIGIVFGIAITLVAYLLRTEWGVFTSWFVAAAGVICLLVFLAFTIAMLHEKF